MQKYLLVIFLTLISLLYDASGSITKIQNWQLNFIENRGQIVDTDNKLRSDIKYYCNAGDVSFYLTNKGISIVQARISDSPPISQGRLQYADYELYRFDLDFINTGSGVELIGKNPLSPTMNFYHPQCPEGITDVSIYSKVIYKNIYEGIDLEFYVMNGRIKYDFIIHPHAAPRDIRMQIKNASANLSDHGELELITPLGNIINKSPVSYAVRNKSKIPVESSYLLNNNIITYKIDKINSTDTLIIDPEIEWASYCGGGLLDELRGGVDDYPGGGFVVAGLTSGQGFPANPGQIINTNGGYDNVIMRFDSKNELMWTTNIGGSNSEGTIDILASKDGSIWISGETCSHNYPVTIDAFQNKNRGGYSDGILVKFSPEGKKLFASYCGGNGYESLLGMAEVPDKDMIWISGQTQSTDLQCTPNAIKNSRTFNESSYFAGVAMDGSLIMLSYYDGWAAEDVAADAEGNPILIGWTKNSDIKTDMNSFQRQFGGTTDAYIAKINFEDGQTEWASYSGGNADDRGFNICHDGDESIYVTGITHSNNMPVNGNAFQRIFAGVSDYFVAKFDDSGNNQWLTYYGGHDSDGFTGENSYMGGIDYNKANNEIAFSGRTLSPDFPVSANASQPYLSGNYDAFYVILNESGELCFSTYCGGQSEEIGYDVHYVSPTCFVGVGVTNSTDFPTTPDALQPDYQGSFDGFLVKICLCSAAPPTITATATSICEGETATLTAGEGYAEYRWSNGESGRSIEVSESGEYWVEVIDELGCTSRSEIIRIEVIQGSPVGIMAMPADSAFRSVPPNLICRDIRLRNLTDSPQTLGFADVYLSNNINFTIPAGQLPMTLAPGAQADLTICFSADKQGELRDTLNLFIATGCGQQVPLLGYGIAEGGTAGSKCGMTIRTGFRELEVFPRVEISPNPASGSAEIRLALAEEDDFCNIKIMNIFGKVLDRIACKSGNHILDTRQYDDGVYFLHFSGKNYAFTRKIIIIK